MQQPRRLKRTSFDPLRLEQDALRVLNRQPWCAVFNAYLLRKAEAKARQGGAVVDLAQVLVVVAQCPCCRHGHTPTRRREGEWYHVSLCPASDVWSSNTSWGALRVAEKLRKIVEVGKAVHGWDLDDDEVSGDDE